MTTIIKANLKKSDDQKNINKYRVAANITEYIYIKINLLENHHSKVHNDKIFISFMI